ncbi:hypothetical protein pipiens_009493 [Culex pipiens pipiens]|uniref:Uncharacterized protein n=2 Tax=Culex pipiens TaxID=7175 RepID=A0ABD1DES4_CULPP
MAYKWTPANVCGPFPKNMVEGGQDSDCSTIFVGRASYNGDLLPAKVIPEKNAAYVAHGGDEVLVRCFEVLCRKELIWERSCGGCIPQGAVAGGKTSDGEPLYVGRGCHDGALTVGKVHRSHGCLYIPYGGAEVSLKSYEVLCER